MHMSQKPFVWQLKGTPAGYTCAVERHMDMSQEAFCANKYKESAVRLSQSQCFVRTCAIEMHPDMSEEVCCAEIYRELAGDGWYNLD